MSVTVQFAALSAVAVLTLGFALTTHLASLVERRAVATARQAGVVAAEVGVHGRLSEEALEHGLDDEQVRALDAALRGRGEDGIRRLKVFNRRGDIVYSDDHEAIGDNHGVGPLVAAALDGRVVSKRVDLGASEHRRERSLGQLIEVFVPLRYGGEVAGVAEVYLPYDETAEAVARDTATLRTIVVAGLLVVWLLLLPIVRAASARLARSSAENEYLALHDALTGLPNRLLAFDRVEQAVERARRTGDLVAVALLDLDRFKEVNDTLGHQHGDELLVEVAERLREVLRAEDTVARLGGDEFALVLPRVPDRATALDVVGKAMDALQRPVLLERLAIDVQGSIGVALFPLHGDDAESLLRRADIAMYRAKAGREAISVYDPVIDDAEGERLILLGELRDAIAADALALAYQPKVDVASGKVVGAEALLRWTHPRHGPISPDRFVPLAEHTGLIATLTDWVLRRAIRDCREWVAAGHDFGVAVNLSPLTLHEPDLVERVLAIVEEAGFESRYLTLEITEGAVMVDPGRAVTTLERLHASGISVSIDDFGTGYSSLSYLQRLPIDELKIDRTFVSHLGRSQEGAVIVQSAIDLGRNLGLRVVAEGVEELDAWRELTDLRCDVAQGYLLSRPVPVGDLLAWVDGGGPGDVVRGQRAAVAPQPTRSAP